MHLWLTPSHVNELITHARSTNPHEACGLIAAERNCITNIVPINNIASQPEIAFELDPKQQTEAMLRFHKMGWTLAAIYHSHPTSAPIPSHTDIRNATYPDTAYLIISLQKRKPQLAAWRISSKHQIERIPLIISTKPPQINGDVPLSPAQKITIIIGMLLTLIFVVAYSIYLLPPAPTIPGS